MSFPNVIYGKYGDEKVAQSATIGGLPLGQILVLPDGRQYRHARAQTSAALSAGQLCVAGSAIPDHGAGTANQLVANSAAIGSTSIVVTAGGTTAIADAYYDGGEMFVRDDTGEGHVYKINTNNSTATGSTATISLEKTDGLAAALGASATVGLRRNPYGEVITRATGSAQVGPIVGVPTQAVSSGFYTWLQTKGVGPGLVAATAIVIGQGVTASSAIAGACAPINSTAATTLVGLPYNEIDIIGVVHVVSPSTEYALVNWKID